MKIALPTRSGWCVEYYTGETKTLKNGQVLRCIDIFESTNRNDIDNKINDLKSRGYEIKEVYECIF